MKRICINFNIYPALLMLCLTLGLFTLGHAQTFKASIVAGINLSQLDGDDLSGFNKLGLNTGLRVSANLSERWSMSTEFLYSEQGASASTSDYFTSVYDKIRLKFVEVPLMINFSDWKVLASTGVSYNRLAAYEVIDLQGEDITEVENYNDNVFAIIFGATMFFNEKIALNIRWSKYLNNLRTTTDTDNTRFLGRNIGIRMYYTL